MKNVKSISLRINDEFKKRCDDTFHRLGMNLHAGINLFLSQMILYQRLPFDVAITDVSQKRAAHEKNITVMIKTEDEIRRQCAQLAKKAGLNLSTLISMYLVQVVDKQAIPFQILTSEIEPKKN